MAYTSAQIVNLAAQIAKAPGYVTYAGQFLNAILEELWQVNDFAFSRQVTIINTTQAMPSLGYPLPSNHERTLNSFYTVDGVPTTMTQIPIEEFDTLPSILTGSSYPQFLCVDVSQSPRTVRVYPVPPLAVTFTMRYLPQQLPITTPETSSVVPWFPNQLYLITRLAAELMMVTDDSRRDDYLKQAEMLLSKFLTMGEDDRENYVRQVKLDSRYFKSNSSAKATKLQPL